VCVCVITALAAGTLWCQALQAFAQSLLNLRPPRPAAVVQFLVPDDAMLKRLDDFFKTNARANILDQNVNILAKLNESRNSAADPVGRIATVEHQAAASPAAVHQQPTQPSPHSIDVVVPLTIGDQVTALTAAYGQGVWVWGFGKSTFGGIRLLPRRAESPETFYGGMTAAATAIAVVRAVAGIGWRGEVNVIGLRSKNSYFDVATVEEFVRLLLQFQAARASNSTAHVSVVVRPLLAQKNNSAGILFQRKMTVKGYESVDAEPTGGNEAAMTPTASAVAGIKSTPRGAGAKCAVIEPSERAREHARKFDNLTLEVRQAILGLNFGRQQSLGIKLQKSLKGFLVSIPRRIPLCCTRKTGVFIKSGHFFVQACMREFAVAREGGRYTAAECKKKTELFTNLSASINEELSDMQGYLDRALKQLKGFFSGGQFMGRSPISVSMSMWLVSSWSDPCLFSCRHDRGVLEQSSDVPGHGRRRS